MRGPRDRSRPAARARGTANTEAVPRAPMRPASPHQRDRRVKVSRLASPDAKSAGNPANAADGADEPPTRYGTTPAEETPRGAAPYPSHRRSTGFSLAPEKASRISGADVKLTRGAAPAAASRAVPPHNVWEGRRPGFLSAPRVTAAQLLTEHRITPRSATLAGTLRILRATRRAWRGRMNARLWVAKALQSPDSGEFGGCRSGAPVCGERTNSSKRPQRAPSQE